VRVLDYKYAKYKEMDAERKMKKKLEAAKQSGQQLDDGLLETFEKQIDEEKDEWEEIKLNKERVEVANAKRLAIFYLEAAVQASNA